MLENQVKISTGLFGVDKLDDIFMFNDWKNTDFEMNSFKLFFSDILEWDFFDGIFGFGLLSLCLIDDRIRAFPNGFG